MEHSDPDSRLAQMTQRLNRLGLRATPQRLAILDYIEDNTSHPSVEEIFKELKPLFPSLSPATVYGTLETLSQAGELLEVNIDPARRRFDPNPRPHAHFLCKSCGRVYDIDFPLPYADFPLEVGGFLAESFAVNLHGLCPACRSSGK